MKKKHFVSIIIVNYNGRNLLEECLSSISRINYPKNNYEVIVVDNNSMDDTVSFVHTNYPEVYLVRNDSNLGFVGGNKMGLRYAHGEYIVLLNSDTRVDPNWLDAMVEAAENPKVGIVNSKLYYATPFIELSLHSSVDLKSNFNKGNSFSFVGVLLENIVCSRKDLTDQIWYGSGFYGFIKNEVVMRWTKDVAQILLPIDQNLKANRFKLTLHGPQGEEDKGSKHFALKIGEKILVEDSLSQSQVKQYSINLPTADIGGELIWLIQNAGNIVLASGYGKDRGSLVLNTNQGIKEFYERDCAYFEKQNKLLAFCGASCLIKRKVIDQVGFFDDKYFMYYEDLDLSLRTWLANWDILYEPKSIVFHKHKASTKEMQGAFVLRHVERNHIYFLLTYFPFNLIWFEIVLLLSRLLVTRLWMFFYAFREDLTSYEMFRQKYLARKQALIDVVSNLSYFLSKRYQTQYIRPNARKLLAQLMY